MRIGIDARELCGHTTGVGRYLSGLLRDWTSGNGAGRHDLILYAPAPLPDEWGRTRLVPGVPGTWWEQVRLPRAAAGDRLDVFFAPAYTAPLRLGVPFVVTIHDLSFVAHPEWFRPREGLRRRWLTRHAARRARAILTVSAFSQREIVERFGVPEGRVVVTPSFLAAPVAASARADEPRVLFVGSIFNRRHVPDLIRAVGRVARTRPGVSLDIVGDNRTYPHESLEAVIAAEGLQARVRWHAYVQDAELRQLYERARGFVFLSEYEGLGLTPLEAMTAGVPPLVADIPVAHESCGDAALYVPPADVGAIAAGLDRLLFDDAVRARLLAAAPAVLTRYDWHRTAQRTLDVLEAAGHAREPLGHA